MARTSVKTSTPMLKLSDNQRILQLIATGASNEAIFAYFGASYPAILPTEQERTRFNHGKYIAPNKQLADDIRNQIRVCRSQYDTQQKQSEIAASFYGKDKVVALSDVEPEPITRISTGLYTQDWLWGYHPETIKGKNYNIYGPPRSKITLLGGERGVGKTRWIIMTGCQMIGAHKNEADAPYVLIIQNEVTKGEYAAWVKNYLKEAGLPSWVVKHILVAELNVLQTQLDTFVEVDKRTNGKLDLVVVDSLNMVEGSNTNAGQFLICDGYHNVCHKLSNGGPHIIFIAHMNKQHEIKGSTAIQHYVDVVMYARKSWIAGQFTIECPDKNRYGETGKKRKYRHEGPRVVPMKEDGDENIQSLVELYHKAQR